MPQLSKRVLFTSCAVLLLTASLLCIISSLGGGMLLAVAFAEDQLLAAPTPTPYPIHQLSPKENTSNLPEEISEKMDEIQVQIIQVRSLEPDQSLKRELLSADQLREKVRTEFLADYSSEEAIQDAKILNIIGLLDPGFDLIGFYNDLYSEQIAGYYDNSLMVMYVVKGSSFGGLESSTFGHEYVHALQDQNYDIKNGLKFSKEDCENNTERCFGIQALIEGDATVTEQLWLTSFASKQDRLEILEFYQQFQSPVYDAAPEFMRLDFLFPYQYGAEFVYTLLDLDGWHAVDLAYLNPPLSSEQIMHPDRYPQDIPIFVTIKNAQPDLGSEWEVLDTGELGEWYTYLILAHGYLANVRLSDGEARIAAKGWGGDRYVVYQNTNNQSLIYTQKYIFDTDSDATEFFNALTNYGDRRWVASIQSQETRKVWSSEFESAAIYLDRDTVTWVIAPDLTLLNTIIQFGSGEDFRGTLHGN